MSLSPDPYSVSGRFGAVARDGLFISPGASQRVTSVMVEPVALMLPITWFLLVVQEIRAQPSLKADSAPAGHVLSSDSPNLSSDPVGLSFPVNPAPARLCAEGNQNPRRRHR